MERIKENLPFAAKNGRTMRDEDDGAVLITVLMIALFFFIAIIAVATYAMYSVRDTALHTTQISSYAAAEGARDQGIADIENDECSEETVQIENADFEGEYTMYWEAYDSETPRSEIPNDVLESNGSLRTTLNNGCADAEDLETHGENDELIYTYIVSTGYSEGMSDTLVNTYGMEDLETFEYSVSSFGSFNFGGIPGVYEPSGEKDVVLAQGSLQCTAMSVVEGSVYLLDETSNSQIGNCGVIGGDLHTAGDIRINGGNQGLIIEGDLCVEGRVLEEHHAGIEVSVAGNITTEAGPGGCHVLDMVRENMWVDYSPNLDDAVVADNDMCVNRTNFDHEPWYDGRGALFRFIDSYDGDGDLVIDMTNCSQALDINGWNVGNLELERSVTIVSDHINRINSLPVTSGDGEEHQFNLVVPDRISVSQDNQSDVPMPHCEGRTINVSMLTYDENTAGLIYTPCGGINFENGNFRGQLYSGQGDINGGSATFTHVDVVGLPENDLAGEQGAPGVASVVPIHHIER